MSYNPQNPNGQTVSSASSPVVIASDQSPVSVSISQSLPGTSNAVVLSDNTGNDVATLAAAVGQNSLLIGVGPTNYVLSATVSGNSSTVQLAAGATFTGTIESIFSEPQVSVLMISDQPGVLTFNQYIGTASNTIANSLSYVTTANQRICQSFTVNGNYFNITYTNTGGSPTTTFNLNTAYGSITPTTTLSNMPMGIMEINGATAISATAGVLKIGVVGNNGQSFDGATGGAVPNNALYNGLKAAITFPATVTNGSMVGAMGDKAGRIVTVTGAPRDLLGTTVLNTGSTVSTVLIASGGAGVFNDISNLIITNETSTATIVTLTDAGAAGTVYKFSLAANGGISTNFNPPLPQGTGATSWNVLSSAGATCDFVAVWIKNK